MKVYKFEYNDTVFANNKDEALNKFVSCYFEHSNLLDFINFLFEYGKVRRISKKEFNNNE